MRNRNTVQKSLAKRLQKLRKSQGKSLTDVSSRTHIREDFIRDIEEGKYTQVGEPAQVKGFLQVLSYEYDTNEELLLALFRKDRPQQSNSTQDNGAGLPLKVKKLLQVHKLPILFSFLILATLGVFLVMFSSAFAPPQLILTSPITANEPGEYIFETTNETINIVGAVGDQTTVRVNSDPQQLDPLNTFTETQIPLTARENIFVVEAENLLDRKVRMEITVIRTDIALTAD